MTPTPVAAKGLAFDAAYYPHLMDKIISAASLPALLTLRQTSRTFRARIEALLNLRGCHMVLSPGNTEMGIKFAVRDGPSFLVAEGQTAHLLARYTHLLDVYGGTRPRTVLDAASRVRFGALKMTRVPNVGAVGAIYDLEGATFVVSLKYFSGNTDDIAHRPEPYAYPYLTSKVVINLEVHRHAGRALTGNHIRLFDGEYVKEFVIIFTPTRSHYSTQRRADEGFLDVVQAIHDAVWMSELAELYVQYTFVDVGVLEDPTSANNLNPELSHDRMRDKITLMIESLYQSHRIISSVYHSTLRFLRLHEYRAEVGDDLVALETLAPQTMPPRC